MRVNISPKWLIVRMGWCMIRKWVAAGTIVNQSLLVSSKMSIDVDTGSYLQAWDT